MNDFIEEEKIYQDYLKKKKELEPHIRYARAVGCATGGSSQTPVKPLATMGTNGGPLLCDHCGEPIVLEGGKYHGVHANVAWAQEPDNATKEDWRAWMLGGLVVETITNGTLRIYHGYPGNCKQCYEKAKVVMEKAKKAFIQPEKKALFLRLNKFFSHKLPELNEKDRLKLVNDVIKSLCYDPGIGVNRP